VEGLELGEGAACCLKEYGGCMAPVWSAGYADADLVVYVVDATNCTQISAATILLVDTLGHEALRDKPFLLVFNKMDRGCPMSLTEYKSVMRLGDILRHAPQRVQVVEGSCVEGYALTELVYEWLLHTIRPSWKVNQPVASCTHTHTQDIALP
jgi:50S ribosomal subunit-associated GTPase HflX